MELANQYQEKIKKVKEKFLNFYYYHKISCLSWKMS
jgi:hypothetical protein